MPSEEIDRELEEQGINPEQTGLPSDLPTWVHGFQRCRPKATVTSALTRRTGVVMVGRLLTVDDTPNVTNVERYDRTPKEISTLKRSCFSTVKRTS
jgi:hypothetical protein